VRLSLYKSTCRLEWVLYFNENRVFDHYSVIMVGINKVINEYMFIIDKELCIKFPAICLDISISSLLK
jgi:hypothetical protein